MRPIGLRDKAISVVRAARANRVKGRRRCPGAVRHGPHRSGHWHSGERCLRPLRVPGADGQLYDDDAHHIDRLSSNLAKVVSEIRSRNRDRDGTLSSGDAAADDSRRSGGQDLQAAVDLVRPAGRNASDRAPARRRARRPGGAQPPERRRTGVAMPRNAARNDVGAGSCGAPFPRMQALLVQAGWRVWRSRRPETEPLRRWTRSIAGPTG